MAEQIDPNRTPIGSYLRKRRKNKIDIKAMRDMLSYEMFMILVIKHLQTEKEKRDSL
jgi:hypothetical protein